MKRIYIILTHTGTILSRIVRFYTRKTYTHSSIALDEKLNQMYSFGRLNPYNAFLGGFVHERINKGTFKRFKNTVSAVYWIEVTDEQYEVIKSAIKNIGSERKSYKFNIIRTIFCKYS